MRARINSGLLLLLAWLLFVAPACRTSQVSAPAPSAPIHQAMLLSAPDPAFRLTPEQRAQLHPVDDPELVQQFISWFRPEHRAEVIQAFTFWREGAEMQKIAVGPIQMTIDHPQLQAIVHKINMRRAPGREGPS